MQLHGLPVVKIHTNLRHSSLHIGLKNDQTITFCCHQIAQDLSFNLMYCDLEYDHLSKRYNRECEYQANQTTITAVYP